MTGHLKLEILELVRYKLDCTNKQQASDLYGRLAPVLCSIFS